MATPAVYSGALLNKYALPKFAVLLVGSSALAGLLVVIAAAERSARSFAFRFVAVAAGYVVAVGVSTAASAEPVIAFEGLLASRMGFLSYACFTVCVIATVVLAAADRKAFDRVLASTVVAGAVVAGAAAAQLVGLLPIDTRPAVAGTSNIARVYGTIGHPDFAAKFLLLALFAGIGVALSSASRAWRAFGGATAGLAAIAVVYSGTRGAWVGSVVGVAVAVAYALRTGLLSATALRARQRMAFAVAAVVLIAAPALFLTAPGAPVRERLAALAREGFTGAGRTTIWKTSLRMLPRYWLLGTGPEMFRLAVLPYKTDDLERATSGVAIEDPHDAYLSSLLITGLPATALYVALVAMGVWGFAAGSRRARSSKDRTLGVALLAGLVATLAHDVFIHHMIPNALYLFVYLALGVCWERLHRSGDSARPTATTERARPTATTEGSHLAAAILAFVLPLLLAAPAAVYAARLVGADVAIYRCGGAARAGDDAATRLYGERATHAGTYQSDPHYYYGAALERLVDTTRGIDAPQRLAMAATQMEQATEHTVSPTSNLVSLALVEIRRGDLDAAASAVDRAEAIDPHSHLVHLARSSYWLRMGKLALAVDEFKAAQALGAPFERLEKLKANLRAAIRRSPDKRALRRSLLGVQGGGGNRRRAEKPATEN